MLTATKPLGVVVAGSIASGAALAQQPGPLEVLDALVTPVVAEQVRTAAEAAQGQVRTDVFVVPAKKPELPAATKTPKELAAGVLEGLRTSRAFSRNGYVFMRALPAPVQRYFVPDHTFFRSTIEDTLLTANDKSDNGIVLRVDHSSLWEKQGKLFGFVWLNGGTAVPVTGTIENRWFGKEADVSLRVAGEPVSVTDGPALASSLRALHKPAVRPAAPPPAAEPTPAPQHIYEGG